MQRTAVDLRAGMALYLDTLEAAGRTSGTAKNYGRVLTRLLARVEGRDPVNLDVRDLLDSYKSVNSRSFALVIVRQWFKFLQARGLVDTDPTQGIPIPKAQRRNYAPISWEDFLPFRDALPTEELQVLATVLFFTGARIREALSLRVEDVSFDGGYGTLEFRGRKGGQAGFAAFGPEVASVIRPWLARKAGNLFKMGASTVRYHFLKTGAVLGFPGAVTPHRLRHSFICWAVDAGWNQLVLQQQVGHGDPASTAWYYRPSRTALVGAYRRAGR